MKKLLLCRLFGAHKLTIESKAPIIDERQNEVGICYTLRCENCGRIYNKYVYTKIGYINRQY